MRVKNGVLYALSLGGILAVWQILTNFYSPLILPKITTVLKVIGEILSNPEQLHMITITMTRLFTGLVIGLLCGVFFGVMMGLFKWVRTLCSPIIGLIQTMPPVSWILLALVWFGLNGRPAVFIVALSTIPIIAINIAVGIEGVDRQLLEMAQVFNFSRKKIITQIIIPSVFTHLKSAFKIAFGVGWKISVMAEVLTTTNGIGGMIKTARLNLEPETILAWSVIVMVLFAVTNLIFDRLLFRRKNASAH